MKKLTKTVTLGELKFKIAINRDIAVDIFEQFPAETKSVLEFTKGDSEEKLYDALENKTLKNIFLEKDKAYACLSSIVNYALPLILKEADDETSSTEILKVVKENELENVFNTSMFDFIAQGFTLDELGKPNIKFVIK